MDLNQLTQESMEKARALTRKILDGPDGLGIQKAITTTTGASGITGYILEAPAQQLVPLLSPFRQTIPRKTQPGATAVNWKVITAISVASKFSTAENFSANGITYNTSDKTAAFRVVGRLGSVTRESIAAGQNFDDVKAREVTNTLLRAMVEEEQAIIGGNRTAFGAAPTPTLLVRGGLGSLAAAAGGLFVRVVALTEMAANRLSVDRPNAYNGTDAFLAGNGHTASALLDLAADGVGIISAEAGPTGAVALGDALKITWTPVTNAFAYAVFVSSVTNTEKLEAIVTQTSVTITSLAGTGVQYTVARGVVGAGPTTLTGGDSSGDSLIFDGIVPLLNADANAYKKNVGGTLTVSSSTGEVKEIMDMVQALYDTWKIDDFRLVCGSPEGRNITKGSIAAGAGPTILVDPNGGTSRTELLMGYHVSKIVNSVTGKVMPVDVLPWLPGGMIICLPTKLPFPLAGVEQPFEIAASYGWEQLDYAMTPNSSAFVGAGGAAVAGTGPVSAFEVRAWECLKAYFPGGCGLLYNIFNG